MPFVCRNHVLQGELLALAQDIGDRLMPAFSESPTGLPYAWVNLRHGVRSFMRPLMECLWHHIQTRRPNEHRRANYLSI